MVKGLVSDDEINAGALDGFVLSLEKQRYGVYWLDHVQMYAQSQTDQSTYETFLGQRVTDKFRTIMVNPGLFLTALMQGLTKMGAKLWTKKSNALRDLARLSYPTLVNCFGLGADLLFGDENMFPIRGQLTPLKPQPGIDYSYISRGPNGVLYMFPRRGNIGLGGPHQRDNDQLQAEPTETERQLREHTDLMAKFSGVPRINPDDIQI
ncbi:MAG: FAD-dependent oxidoreductase [Parasphingorhabdus sp.]